MFDGRLWHISEALGFTACGRGSLAAGDPSRMPEILEGSVPDGAWVCARCVRELSVRARVARQMLRNDPRRGRVLTPEEIAELRDDPRPSTAELLGALDDDPSEVES